MKKYNIAIADDHTLFRCGLKLLLSDFYLIENIYEASNGQEFINLIQKVRIDMVFMDIDMPIMNGIDSTIQSLEINPELKVVALSMYGDAEYYYKMIDAGAKGFILKDSNIEYVKKAIEVTLQGKNYFSQDILYSLVKNPKKNPIFEQLSVREIEVLQLICDGFSNKEIAEKLFVSKRTVDKHRENLLSKTASKNTAGLIIFAIKNNIIKL